MSVAATATLPLGEELRRSYTVHTWAGCTLIDGSLPIDHMAAFMKLAGRDEVLSVRLAQLSNSTLGWGPKDAVAALEAELTAQEEKRLVGACALERWLGVGERGESSNAIVCHLRGRALPQPQGPPARPRRFAALHQVAA